MNGDQAFMPWPALLRHAGLHQAPAYLKMDVEGHEWSVLAGMMKLVASHPTLLPAQIAFELHYQELHRTHSQFARAGGFPQHNAVQIALFFNSLYRTAGFVLIDRNDNPLCDFCTELVIARICAAPVRA